MTIVAKDNTFRTGVGIGGTENTTLTVIGNLFETTVEAIGWAQG